MKDHLIKENDLNLAEFLAPFYVLLSVAAILSRRIEILKTLASHGKTCKSPSKQCWWISKKCFVHFYLAGVLSLLVATSWHWNSQPLSLPQVLLFLHLFRRIYECIYVHQSRPTSQMHIAGYLLGVGHYIILPLVFFVARPTSATPSPILALIIGIANLWMQYEQYQHHLLLALLRTATSLTYPLPPQKRWFRYILCPHYLAEILIYLTWAILLQLESPGMTRGETQHSMPSFLIFLLNTGRLYKHWFLFLWVTVNLSISSRNNYEWYKSRSSKLSQSSALIPKVF